MSVSPHSSGQCRRRKAHSLLRRGSLWFPAISQLYAPDHGLWRGWSEPRFGWSELWLDWSELGSLNLPLSPKHSLTEPPGTLNSRLSLSHFVITKSSLLKKLPTLAV